MIWEIEDGPRAIEGLDERGRPRPEYAAGLGLVPAPIGRRVLAMIIEGVFIGLLQLPMLLVALPAIIDAVGTADPVDAVFGRSDAVWIVVCSVVPYALTTVFLLVQLIVLGRRGATLGKALTGLRAVNVKTLERPRFWRGAVVRYLVQVGSLLIPVIGPLLVIALSPLFDPDRRRRGWPDLAGQTYLVDIRKGLNPYDAKRMRIARKTLATDLRDEKASLPSLATPVSGPATDVYIPVARNRGGVLGAPKDRVGSGERPSADDGPAAPIQESPFAVDSAPAVAPPTREPVVIARPATEPTAAAPTPEPQSAPASRPEPLGAPAASASSAAPAETLLPGATSSTWSAPELIPHDPPPPAAAAAPTASLVLDSGEQLDIPATGAVLGRAPSVAGADAGAVPLAVADSTKSVSKTHVALRWVDGALVAVDLGSTNGSGVIREGAETELDAGAPATLRSGDTLRFGDRHASVRLT
ncbi:RDD family protein [Microbacterium sp. NPDC091382]|uniref:RDD family protein n=1 Tax=Microbacterium sp. NPDC091382 TaxID=3364210 RepID=UPI003805B946